MKKTIFVLLAILIAPPAFSQNTAGLDKWITGFRAGQTGLAGRAIVTCTVERSGALVVIDRAGLPLRLNIIKPISLERLGQKLGLLDRAVLADRELAADAWSIVPAEGEIDFGLKDEMTLTLKLSSFRVCLDADTVLELAPRLEADPQFLNRAAAAGFTYTLSFRGVGTATGRRDAFPGWPEFIARTTDWIRKGVAAGTQETLALVLETRVMKLEEKQAQKRIVLSKDEKSDQWFGFEATYFNSNAVNATPGSIHFSSYHTVAPMAYISWRNLGNPDWFVKPFRVTVAFGGFFEFNSSYFSRRDVEFAGYPETGGSFMIAYGPCVAAELAVIVPRIENDKHTGDLFGMGIELLAAFNVPYLFPDYFYEYFLNTYLNFVFHFIPLDGYGVDGIVGVNLALGTTAYDVTLPGIIVSNFGLSLGARFKLDVFNYFKSDKMFE